MLMVQLSSCIPSSLSTHSCTQVDTLHHSPGRGHLGVSTAQVNIKFIHFKYEQGIVIFFYSHCQSKSATGTHSNAVYRGSRIVQVEIR